MLKYFILVAATAFAVSCSSQKFAETAASDPYLWLEDIESPKSLEFAKAENEKTLSVLQNDPHYKSIEAETRKLAYAKDRIPWAYPMKGYFYNFWRDEKSARGLWRRTTLSEYRKNNPKWEVILDLDELSKKENDNWVWHGSQCLPPRYERCLIFLSRGGKDASVVREFDLKEKSFVKNGFELPEAKSNVKWIDQDSIYVATDNGPDSLTNAGYARTVKYLKRGQKLSEAPVIFEVDKNEQSASAYVEHTQTGKYHFLSERISFFQTKIWSFENGVKTLIQMPTESDFYGYFKGYVLFILKKELKTEKQIFKAGSLVALPFDKITDSTLADLELIFGPTDKIFLESLETTKNHILLNIIDNIQGKVVKVTFKEPHNWALQNIDLGKNGVASVMSTEIDNDNFSVTYNDFITPTSMYIGNTNAAPLKLTKIKTAPEKFVSLNITSEQKFVKSTDGVMIPYFIIHKKDMKYNGKNPTLLYGYGGFEVSMQPYYLGGIGKSWLERGGVYIMSNIRGGGEFGPAWHMAAVKENHQIVFDDFIAIANDLIKNKVTTPAHLGIMGGSNGGLLVGGTFIQRPDLFNAVVCEVPLLDMLRYHKLLAGASWMDEYGNPEDPKMREVILKYSPYQNVKADVKYPEVFFYTSTKDDRVHPAHSRKMVAKMREQGHPLFYYENIEGGHGGAANLEQGILRGALEFTYLWRKLQ